jgi:hypothetical protein
MRELSWPARIGVFILACVAARGGCACWPPIPDLHEAQVRARLERDAAGEPREQSPLLQLVCGDGVTCPDP